MAISHVVSGLIAKRAEVAGQITHLDAELRRLRAALEHLDATLVFLDPASSPRASEVAACRTGHP